MSINPWQDEAVIRHSQHLLQSFKHWMGNDLLAVSCSPTEIAVALFTAPICLVSHGTESDPIFNYGNRQALALWGLTWEQFTQMPSRYTAEPMVQAERDRLLATTADQGWSNYSGIRITSTGKRFEIQAGIIWNILDQQHQYCGQAAMFSQYKFL